MAIVLYPAGAEKASGKIRGAFVYSPWREFTLARELVTPRNPQTSYQQNIRNILVGNAAAYKTLTEAQVASWVAFTQNFTYRRLGVPYLPTGINAFVVINFFRMFHSLTRLLDPPAFAVLPAPISLDWLKWDSAGEKVMAQVTFTPTEYETTDYWHFEMTDQTTPSRRSFKRDYRLLGFMAIGATSPQELSFDPRWTVAVDQVHRCRIRAVSAEGIPGPYITELLTAAAYP